jgi:hypothetical protein
MAIGKEMSRLKLKRVVRDTFEAIDADGDARFIPPPPYA